MPSHEPGQCRCPPPVCAGRRLSLRLRGCVVSCDAPLEVADEQADPRCGSTTGIVTLLPALGIRFDGQQIEQQPQIERAHFSGADRRHPSADALGRVVRYPLDFDRLRARSRQLARIRFRHELLVAVRRQHVGRVLPEIEKVLGLSRAAIAPPASRAISSSPGRRSVLGHQRLERLREACRGAALAT